MDLHGNYCILFMVLLLVRLSLAINEDGSNQLDLINPKGRIF